jgi:hypothetical protein
VKEIISRLFSKIVLKKGGKNNSQILLNSMKMFHENTGPTHFHWSKIYFSSLNILFCLGTNLKPCIYIL